MTCSYRRTCRLPHGFKVEFILDGSRFDAKWFPKMPRGKRIRQLLPHYKRERNAFLASTGVRILVVDL